MKTWGGRQMGRSPAALWIERMNKRNRRAALAWTAEGGCPYAGASGPGFTLKTMLLSIEKLIYGGDGLARTPAGADGRSMAVFVPFVLPGEKVEAAIRQEKSGFARGSVVQLIEASPDRVEAHCPYFRQCGGRRYQHIPSERQPGVTAPRLRETRGGRGKKGLRTRQPVRVAPLLSHRSRTRSD